MTAKIGILGLGLIGGSIAKGIKKRAPEIQIATVQREDHDMARACAEGIVDEVFPSLEAFLLAVDLVFLATPLSAIIPLAQKIAQVGATRQQPLLVADVGSVKRKIATAFEELSTSKLAFLPTHPMAGKEKNGFEASCEDLFLKAPWVVTPHAKTTPSSLEKMGKLITLLGAKRVFLTPEEHDGQTALVSHLPSMLAHDFLDFVMEIEPNALNIAGPGFHSFTRLAHDCPTLRREIFAQNQEWIEMYLSKWVSRLLRGKFHETF